MKHDVEAKILCKTAIGRVKLENDKLEEVRVRAGWTDGWMDMFDWVM